ncbi:MAG: hotdog fold thioesterase [Methanomassiliicoccales archaeon]|nr:MAG: hotdog fold thioesterase [Methanomassiliicoccales archaeon]
MEPPMDVSERIEAINNCEYAKRFDMRVTLLTKEEVRVEMPIRGNINGFKIAHGGAIFTLADEAFALIGNLGEYPEVAMSASIRYLRPAKEDMVAIARKVSEDDRTSTYKVDVISGGVLVAEFEGVGYKLKGKK